MRSGDEQAERDDVDREDDKEHDRQDAEGELERITGGRRHLSAAHRRKLGVAVSRSGARREAWSRGLPSRSVS
eukprot:9485196-Pyramimonas_sp.AAC.1